MFGWKWARCALSQLCFAAECTPLPITFYNRMFINEMKMTQPNSWNGRGFLQQVFYCTHKCLYTWICLCIFQRVHFSVHCNRLHMLHYTTGHGKTWDTFPMRFMNPRGGIAVAPLRDLSSIKNLRSERCPSLQIYYIIHSLRTYHILSLLHFSNFLNLWSSYDLIEKVM